ncbi:PspC domain-containing protein [Litorimonas sp. RW-G-Af-16]|uniref:PspC domain-containing protein n=1 Tax=Litorimonas sp. RW-G-Af-16 TaxID=3241168 RepID=UPI00390C50E4
MGRKYKNKIHRAMLDENWEGDDDGYDYAGPNKLRRNKIDGIFGGVCSGFGDYLGLDHTVVRILFVLSVIFLGFPLLAYFILWLFIPSDKRAPYRREYREMRQAKRQRKGKRRKAYTAYQEEEDFPTRQTTATYNDVRSKFRSLETRLQDLERNITSKEWKLRRDFRDLES